MNNQTENKKLIFVINIGSYYRLKENYFYSKGLQEGINEIMHIDEFEQASEEVKDCIDYFRNNKSFVYDVLRKDLKPFLNEDTATECCVQRLLKSAPNVTKDIITQFQLDIFAGAYIKDKVREDLVSVYKQIKNYSDFICKKFLEEE